MRLELCQIVKIDLSIFFNSLENNDSTSSVSYRKQLPVLVEGQGRQQVLLSNISWVRLT